MESLLLYISEDGPTEVFPGELWIRPTGRHAHGDVIGQQRIPHTVCFFGLGKK